MSIRVLGDLELSGVLRWKKNLSDFPLNPEPYTLITKDGIPYFYTELVNGSGFFSWQPIGIKQASYLHVQGVASSVWTVRHNFNTEDFAYFVYDSNHNLMIADIAIVDLNTIQVELSEAMTGTVVLFSLQYLNSTTISASQQLNLGTAVLTSNAGVLEVNNNPLAFTQYVDAQDAALGARIDSLVSNTDPSAIDSLSEIVTAFQTADGDLNSAISSMSTNAASALATEVSRAQVAENSLQSALDIVNTVLATKADSSNVDAQISALESQILSNIQAYNTSLSNEIPTAVSQLANDSGYQVASDVAAAITGKADKSSLAIVATSGSYSDLSNKPVIPAVPAVVSSFTNDSGYQTSAQVASAIASASASAAGNSLNDFAAKTLTVSGNIMPSVSGVSNIGSPTDKFDAIYTKELHLDANTLYLNGVPVLGSTAATMNFTADVDQGITISTSGTGETVLNSQAATIIQTSGQNADVVVQAGGQGSMARISSATEVLLTAPLVAIAGNQTVSGNVTISGNLTISGTNTIVQSTTMTVTDNIVTLNKGEPTDGVTLNVSGFEVDRGGLSRERLIWNQSANNWQMGQTGQEINIASQAYVSSAVTTATSALATVAMSGKYSDLSGLPTIPAVPNVLSAFSNDAGYQTSSQVASEISSAIASKANVSSLSLVATSGSYADLTNKPVIPSVVSALTNDVGYQNSTQVNAAIQAVVGAAPAALNTLAKIDAQLASDESAVAALVNTVSGKANAATTLGGYGITDAMTASAIAAAIAVETARAEAAEALLATQANTYTKAQVDAAIATAIANFAATLYV